MENDEVLLLDCLPSIFGMRVRVELAEKEIKYDYKEEDLIHGNKSPLLLEINPIHKKVPVLIHNGKSICESLIAVHYIDEVWKEKAPLLPSDHYKRAQARFCADYIDNKLHESWRKIYTTKTEEHEGAKKDLIVSLKLLELEALGDEPYLGGQSFDFLDIVLIGFYTWFYAYEILCNISMEVECPKLVAWGKRCMQRETVSKTLPDPHKIYELLLEIRKVYGLE